MIKQILDDLVETSRGAHAAIFLDGDGETISQTGQTNVDMQLIGAWKEIELDRIKAISHRLGLGGVNAVLFSLDEGNVMVVPVADEYCLLLFLSAYASVQDAMHRLNTAVESLRKDIS